MGKKEGKGRERKRKTRGKGWEESGRGGARPRNILA